jgi:hypothetical protein
MKYNELEIKLKSLQDTNNNINLHCNVAVVDQLLLFTGNTIDLVVNYTWNYICLCIQT